jgi:hypothetical protein
MDFIVDGLATGRMVRILSVVDAYTREFAWREEYNCERPIARSPIARHRSSARHLKGARPWPCSLSNHQPSNQMRISSYLWMRTWGRPVTRGSHEGGGFSG